MRAVVEVVLPVFGIMLAGYLGGRFRVLGAASSEALNRFVYFVALPALFFVSLSRVPVSEALNVPFLIAFGGGLLAAFVVAVVVGRRLFSNSLATIGLQGLSANFSNTGYLGVPLLLIVFGEAGKLPGILGTVIMGAVVMAIGIAIVEADLNRGGHPLRVLRQVLLAVLRSPLVLSAAGGLTASSLGWPLPGPLVTFCDILGAAAAHCALFAIGLFLVDRAPHTGIGEVAWVVAIKLFVQPLVTWWLAYRVLEMEPVWAASSVILGALPTGALVFVLAQKYGIYVQRATAAIMVSTLPSVVTLSLLLVLLGAY